jgi:antitoxin (DNA-binding transcriptional repressor) of toxin-antitoxin stability system
MADMTISDYLMVMKYVKIAELKARLSQYLRYVRSGREVTVLDRESPVAMLAPIASGPPLRIREPLKRYRTLPSVPLPKPLPLNIDIVDLLLEERQGER